MRLETWSIHGNSFHFGRHGLGQEETQPSLASDSLFAALVARLAAGAGAEAAAEFAQPFCAGRPPFVLSSTFPLAGRVRFFPAPLARGRGMAEGNVKQLKRITHLSEALYRRILQGQPPAEVYADGLGLQGGSLLVSRAEQASLPDEQRGDLAAPLWQIEQRPRVTLERDTHKSSLFFTGRLVFAANCGLWFGARFMDGGRARVGLEGLLLELAEAGLGAERSIGFGACVIQPGGELELPEKGSGCWTSLSRYLPRADETGALDHPAAAYGLRTVGGWVDSPARQGQRRRPIHLLAEGSVFGPTEREIPGQVADVRPIYASDPDPLGHPVYRSGLALAVAYPGGAV